jgi:hypothetical protein
MDDIDTCPSPSPENQIDQGHLYIARVASLDRSWPPESLPAVSIFQPQINHFNVTH